MFLGRKGSTAGWFIFVLFMYRFLSRTLLFLTLTVLYTACKPEPYTPRPRGYYQIPLPEHAYQTFDVPGFPYSFEYPTYGKIVQDTSFFGQRPENPYWINIEFPELNGAIYLSYKQIGQKYSLQHLLEDAHEMSFFHDKRADYINDTVFHNTHNVVGLIYTVGGNAASAYQFFATDSVSHFLRGALYFDVSPNADSLKPVNEFLKQDMEHLLGTLRWR